MNKFDTSNNKMRIWTKVSQCKVHRQFKLTHNMWNICPNLIISKFVNYFSLQSNKATQICHKTEPKIPKWKFHLSNFSILEGRIHTNFIRTSEKNNINKTFKMIIPTPTPQLFNQFKFSNVTILQSPTQNQTHEKYKTNLKTKSSQQPFHKNFTFNPKTNKNANQINNANKTQFIKSSKHIKMNKSIPDGLAGT